MSICELCDVTKTYGSGAAEVRALSEIDLKIESGEFTVFMGPSGSGKTTLLNLVGCLDAPSGGQVRLEGRDVSAMGGPALAHLRAERIGFIFQSFNLIPVLTALENVELALQLARFKGDKREASVEMLAAVGLGELVDRRPTQLSGGQQQRVAVARALVKKPALVIADEPTANLDSTNGAQVLDIMRDLNERLDVTFLFSTHDPMVRDRAKRIVLLKDGRITDDTVQDGGVAAGGA